MDLAGALGADLTRLSDAHGVADADLTHLLDALSTDARAAVDSFAGVSFVLMVDGRRIAFTALEDGVDEAQIATSVVLPLAALTAVEDGSMLIIYATRAGALVDLAADAAIALGVPPDSVALDAHLPVPGQLSDPSGLIEVMLVNQAIGVLLGRGLRPDAARLEVQRLAWMSDTTIGEASSALLAAAEHSDLGRVAGYSDSE